MALLDLEDLSDEDERQVLQDALATIEDGRKVDNNIRRTIAQAKAVVADIRNSRKYVPRKFPANGRRRKICSKCGGDRWI